MFLIGKSNIWTNLKLELYNSGEGSKHNLAQQHNFDNKSGSVDFGVFIKDKTDASPRWVHFKLHNLMVFRFLGGSFRWFGIISAFW